MTTPTNCAQARNLERGTRSRPHHRPAVTHGPTTRSHQRIGAIAVAAGLALVVAVTARADSPAPPDLLIDVPGAGAAPSALPDTTQMIRRTRAVSVSLDALAAVEAGPTRAARLRLFDDVVCDIVLDAPVRGLHRGQAWRGHVAGTSRGDCTLVSHDNVLAAVVRLPSGLMYEIRPTADGQHVVRELDPAHKLPCGGQPDVGAPTGAQAAAARAATDAPTAPAPADAAPLDRGTATAGASGLPGYSCDDGTVIDVMVVYTAAARTGAGGTAAIEAAIDLAVADANAAFDRSLIDTSLNLVHTAEVIYTETGNGDVDGPRLVATNDGYLDDVHPMRDTYGADCVSLWVNSFNSGGIGYFPDSSRAGIGASGFTIVRRDQAAFLTLAHEIGHNLWCAHDRANAPDPPFANYSYGYREPGSAWRTIMAYPPGTMIPYFANPNVYYSGPTNPGYTGVPVGQPLPCDIALTINETRHIVANFRASIEPGLPPVLYVRAAAPAGGNGQSWPTAFRDLQDALCAADRSGGAVDEIWVAAGTYKPDRGSADRTASFRPRNGVAIYGGFAGTETLRAQRNWTANTTILSGDIGTAGVASDNSYHVVQGDGCDATAILDGFVITAGNANDSNSPNDTGAGVRCANGGAPSLANCTIQLNTAGAGAGLYCQFGSNPTLTGCTFDQNAGTASDNGGGAVYNYEAQPSFTACTFTANTATFGGAMQNAFGADIHMTSCTFENNQATGVNDGGGAVYNYASSPTITDCEFRQNSASFGAGIANGYNSDADIIGCRFYRQIGQAIYNYQSDPSIIRCIFAGNDAQFGSCLANGSGSVPTVWGCVFTGNTADDVGAAVYNDQQCDAVFVNCTFAGNYANYAGAIYSYGASPVLYNCVLWGNTHDYNPGEEAQIGTYLGSPVLQYTTVQGWTGSLGGTGNNGSNPLFVDADGADNTVGTSDDNLRLQSGSPARDTGNNALVPPELTTDLDGHPRIASGTVDRGAYEAAAFAIADYDEDGDVDLADFATFLSCFNGPSRPPAQAGCDPQDEDNDNDVDLSDFATFLTCFNGPTRPPACPL